MKTKPKPKIRMSLNAGLGIWAILVQNGEMFHYGQNSDTKKPFKTRQEALDMLEGLAEDDWIKKETDGYYLLFVYAKGLIRIEDVELYPRHFIIGPTAHGAADGDTLHILARTYLPDEPLEDIYARDAYEEIARFGSKKSVLAHVKKQTKEMVPII